MFSQASVCIIVLQALLLTVFFPSLAFIPRCESYQRFIFGLTLQFAHSAIIHFEFLYHLRSPFTFHTLHIFIKVYLFISSWKKSFPFSQLPYLKAYVAFLTLCPHEFLINSPISH